MIPFVNLANPLPTTPGTGLTAGQEEALTTATRRQPVASIAALKALTPSAGDAVNVLGYYASGDGGGGTFYYDGASSATDNGGTVIAPTAGSGRWLRAYSGAVNVRWFGAKGDGSTDDTAAIQAAVTSGATGGTYVPPGVFLVHGTIEMSPGAVLFGENVVGSYYNGAPFSGGAIILKSDAVGVQDGPAVQLSSSSGVHGLLFKSTGIAAVEGLVSFGEPGAITTNVVNAAIINCCFTLSRNGLTTPQIAIAFQERSLGYANYFHRVSNVVINEADIAVSMSGQCNANTFTNVISRECHIHYRLDGAASECIENSFSGLGLFSMATLTPTPVGFKLSNVAKNNIFSSYCTEMYGKAYEVDATCQNNVFLGVANEATPSDANSQSDLTYARPVNISNTIKMPWVTGTSASRNTSGVGASFKTQFQVSGDMPQQNNNAGTLTAGDADNKVIFRFPPMFKKAEKVSFVCKLRVFAYGAYGNGCGIATVEFAYSMRDATTTAGSLSVISTATVGSEITGLYFLTGVAADAPMGVALVGGNYGAYAFEYIRCALEVTVSSHGSHSSQFVNYHDLQSTASADVTASDVTDAISLLTVAATDI